MQKLPNNTLLNKIILADKNVNVCDVGVSVAIARLAVKDCLGQGLNFSEIIFYSQKLFQMTQFKSFDLYKNEVDFYKRAVALFNILNVEGVMVRKDLEQDIINIKGIIDDVYKTYWDVLNLPITIKDRNSISSALIAIRDDLESIVKNLNNESLNGSEHHFLGGEKI